MLKPIFSILCLSTLLVSCGGASSTGSPGQGPGTPGSGATTKWYDNNVWYVDNKKIWKQVLDENAPGPETGQHSGLYLYKKGEIMYFNENFGSRPNLFSTKDGKSFKSYFSDNVHPIQYVTSTGWIYECKYFSKDGINFIPRKDGGAAHCGGTAHYDGNDSWIIVQDDGHIYIHAGMTSKPSITKVNGFSERYPDKKRLYDIPAKAGAEPAFNGMDTFAFADLTYGIWVSNNLGETWSNRLKNHYSFDAIATNKNYPNLLYAAKPREIYKSEDSGVSWVKINTPKHPSSEIGVWHDMELLDDGVLVIAGTLATDGLRMQVFDSRDFGSTWKEVGGSFKIDGLDAYPPLGGNIEGNADYYFISLPWTGFYSTPR